MNKGECPLSNETIVGAGRPPSTAPSPVLSARGLTKSYQIGKRSVEVLQGISLSVDRGDFVALRGSSGAGKSTLLHLLGGLDTPDAGEIWFGNQNLAQMTTRALANLRNQKIGFVFQSYHLFPELDALENVCLPARIARTPASVAEARGRDLLNRVGLGSRMDHLPAELSGGEQQRVAIARALINEPELILADEPTGNLDSHTGGEIINLLQALWLEKKTTLVIATHDAKVAARAPRGLELDDGQIRVNGASMNLDPVRAPQ